MSPAEPGQAPPPRWSVGDRVVWPHRERAGRRWVDVATPGVVIAVDLPRLPPGAQVRFDRLVNGVEECYATHAELRAEVDDR